VITQETHNLGGATCLLNMDREIETGVTASTVTVETDNTENVTVTVEGDEDVTVRVDAEESSTVSEDEATVPLEVGVANDVLMAVNERPMLSFFAFMTLVTFAVVAPSVVFVAVEFLLTLFGVVTTLVAARHMR